MPSNELPVTEQSVSLVFRQNCPDRFVYFARLDGATAECATCGRPFVVGIQATVAADRLSYPMRERIRRAARGRQRFRLSGVRVAICDPCAARHS